MLYTVQIFRLALAHNKYGLKMLVLATHFLADNFVSVNIWTF